MRHESPGIGDRVVEAEAVVAEALAAFEGQRWPRLVELTDADSVVALKSQYLHLKRSNIGPYPTDPAEIDATELGEEFKEFLRSRRQFGELAGITSIEQAEALDCGEFLTRWAQARNGEYLVDGAEPWHREQILQRREVVGSVAILPDTVAVLVRTLDSVGLSALACYELIAVLGDGAGEWRLDAANGWLGLADTYG